MSTMDSNSDTLPYYVAVIVSEQNKNKTYESLAIGLVPPRLLYAITVMTIIYLFLSILTIVGTVDARVLRRSRLNHRKLLREQIGNISSIDADRPAISTSVNPSSTITVYRGQEDADKDLPVSSSDVLVGMISSDTIVDASNPSTFEVVTMTSTLSPTLATSTFTPSSTLGIQHWFIDYFASRQRNVQSLPTDAINTAQPSAENFHVAPSSIPRPPFQKRTWVKRFFDFLSKTDDFEQEAANELEDDSHYPGDSDDIEDTTLLVIETVTEIETLYSQYGKKRVMTEPPREVTIFVMKTITEMETIYATIEAQETSPTDTESLSETTTTSPTITRPRSIPETAYETPSPFQEMDSGQNKRARSHYDGDYPDIHTHVSVKIVSIHSTSTSTITLPSTRTVTSVVSIPIWNEKRRAGSVDAYHTGLSISTLTQSGNGGNDLRTRGSQEEETTSC